jgi:hypothetical protein
MFHFFDCVFGSVATVPDRLARRANTVVHRISDDGPNLGNFANSILDRRRFFHYTRLHKLRLPSFQITPGH